MARIAMHRAESDEGPDVLRWLDRMLIRLVSASLDKYTINNVCNYKQSILSAITNTELLAPFAQYSFLKFLIKYVKSFQVITNIICHIENIIT